MSNLAQQLEELLEMPELVKTLKRIEKKVNDQVVVEIGEWVLAIIIERRHGLTADAMREYRRDATWAEGIHWQKNQKGRIVYNVPAIDRWMATPE